jgi:hypothetical protein
MSTNEDIERAHQIYCQETGLEISCSIARHFAWGLFLARFTPGDLALVCRDLRRQILKGKRSISCFRFQYFIGDLEAFEELLAEYRARQRKPRFKPGKAQILRATGRIDQPEQPDAESFATKLERTDLAKRLEEWRKRQPW